MLYPGRNTIVAAGRKTASPKIRSQAQLDRAIKKLDALLCRAPLLSSSEQALLRKLTDQVRDYEQAHIPVPEVSNAAILNQLLQANELTSRQLAETTGVPNSVLAE